MSEEFRILPTDVPQNYGVANWSFETIEAIHANFETLFANYGTIVNLQSTDGNITNLTSTNGVISNLLCTNGTVFNLISTSGTISNLNSSIGRINGLYSLSGTIDNLTCISGSISHLTVDTLTIPPLVSSNNLNAVTYDTISNQILYRPNSLTPPGVINQYAGSSAPLGYLLCDGSEVSRINYSDLFSVVGTTYGVGDGLNTFNLPNLKGKIPVGLDSLQSEFDTLGKTGGSKTNTLNVNQLPSHTHSGTTDSAGIHTHGITDPGHAHSSNATGGTLGLAFSDGNNTVESTDFSSNELNVWTPPLPLTINSNTTGISINNSGAHTHTFTTNSTGSGNSVNNLQPYITVNYIIKY